MNPSWNEKLTFVAGGPFDDSLILSLEDKIGTNKEDRLGKSVIPSQKVEKRWLLPSVGDQWINPERHLVEGEEKKAVEFASRLHLRIFLDGVYHVFGEPTYCYSDVRGTSPKLWPNKIGILELGILKVEVLIAMKSKDGRGTTNA